MLQRFDPPQAAGKISARLAALRQQLKAKKLDGFLVPRADAWQGEYIAPCDARLGFISGFTGSAGLAVITAAKAVLFTDGRYTLQAKKQSGALFEVHQAPPARLPVWLKKNLKGRLGYDPWLHHAANIAALKQAGLTLIPLTPNPIDAIWGDRPARAAAEIIPHTLAHAGRSAAQKRKEIARIIKKEGADMLLLTRPDSISWLLNIRGRDVPHTPYHVSHALLHADGSAELFTRAENLSPQVKRHLGNQVAVAPAEALVPRLQQLKTAKRHLLMDGDHTPQILSAAANAKARGGGDPCQLAKACKNAVEIKGARRAHGLDGAALTRFLHWLSRNAAKGVDEITAVKRLESYRAEQPGLQDISFETIAGAGPHGAIIHYRVDEKTNRRLQSGELFLLDSGGQYLSGTTDITRTIAIGAPSARHKQHFTLVLKGHIALARARFPEGTAGAQLDILARQFLWAAGLDYAHGTGHGVGSYLSVHEGPQNISAHGRAPLRAGMIISNEPGYYLPGKYGIRIENLVLVRAAARPKGGEIKMLDFETLSLAPIDISLVERALLTADERSWLNAYHQEVCKRLTPLLPAADQHWLTHATQAI